jgi:hypothetical protein
MSKAKQNTFLTGYFTVLALGAAGLGYLAFSSSTASDEAQAEYETKKTRLNSLLKAPIFPKQENVEAKKKQVEAYVGKVAELNNSLRAFESPLQAEMKTNEFQTKVQKTLQAIVAEAKDSGVKLPEKFDLGFGNYLAGTFAESSAVPRLNAWLDGIDSLVHILISNGVKQINVLNRPELPFEKEAPAAAPDEKGKKGKTESPAAPAPKPAASKDKGKKEPAPAVVLLPESEVLDRYPINVTFTTTNRVLNDVLTALAAPTTEKSPAFFNIRVLRIENSKKLGAETSTLIEVKDEVEESTKKPFKRDSIFIFGDEKIQAQLGIDLIRFPLPKVAEAKK